MSQLAAIHHRERYKEAFEAVVVNAYMEQRTVHGTNRSINYETALTRTPGGHCHKIVRPSMSDFLCDVELAARRSLSKERYKQFNAAYVEQTISVGDLSAEERDTIEQQLGRMLVHRRIFPLPLYFRAKDLR